MKIEKVNENQIRCTLTREDLVSRELKISELAYGTEKAKSLFRDMMRQANFEFGFEAEDIPLMIEAIPLNAECIVLIITKVEDPEELDTRFSRFAPSVTEELGEEDYDLSDAPDEVSDLFRKLQDREKPATSEDPSAPTAVEITENAKTHIRLFQFDSLGQVCDVAGIVGSSYAGQSTLYKDEAAGKYILALSQDSDRDSFDRICNIISEYGIMKRSPAAGQFFLQEHCETLIAQDALQVLGNL